MQTDQICPVVQTAIPSATTATTIIPASGNAARYRHLVSLVITTLNAAVATVTISDGTKTVAVFNYPASAAVPLYPIVWQPNNPVEQSAANVAWTATVSTNGSGVQITAQYVEN